jgi:hypothetical protein
LEIGLVNPLAGGVDADLGVAFGDLFDGYDDFHDEWASFILTCRTWLCRLMRKAGFGAASTVSFLSGASLFAHCIT